MNYLELIAIIFSATGLWKIIEVIIKLRPEKRMQLAEIKKLNVQSEKQIIENWMQWTQVLEKRINELEIVARENKALKLQIENQRKRICELENKVKRVEEENEHLRTQLQTISNNNTKNG